MYDSALLIIISIQHTLSLRIVLQDVIQFAGTRIVWRWEYKEASGYGRIAVGEAEQAKPERSAVSEEQERARCFKIHPLKRSSGAKCWE